MPPRKWRTVTLPEDLVIEVQKVIEEYPELGYTSYSEFIKEAVRERIIQIKSIRREPTPEE